MSNEEIPNREALVGLAARLASCEKVPDHLKRLKRTLRRVKSELRKAKEIVRKEEADVNKLRHASVNAIFPRFLKSKKRQMEIELQEYVTAALNYNACLDQLEMIEFEMAIFERKLGELPALRALWAKELESLKSAIRKSHPEIARQYAHYEDQIQSEQKVIAEIDQAIAAGARCRKYLKAISSQLDKVDSWGRWPRTRGPYSLEAKSALIDKARASALRTTGALAIFEHELKDVFKTLAIADAFSLESFDHFLDTFHDNLVTDWVVQKDLRNSINNVTMAIAKVNRFIGTLRSEKRNHVNTVKQLTNLSHDLMLTTKST